MFKCFKGQPHVANGWWLPLVVAAMLGLPGTDLLGGHAAHAQEPPSPRPFPAGYGFDIPPNTNPLGQPLLDSLGYVRDEAFNRIPLRPDDEKYAGIDGWRMKEHLQEIVAISLRDRDRGTLFWGRHVGFQSHEETQDWVEEHFQAHGLEDVHRQILDLPPEGEWVANSWEITFSSGGDTFTLESARPAAPAGRLPSGARPGPESTPPGGLDLEVVWVGTGMEADYLGRDVTGKVALIQSIPLPGELRHSLSLENAVARAVEKGAAAIGVVYGIGENFSLWPRIDVVPAFGMGYEDGRRLLDLIGQGQTVTVNYQLESELRQGLQTAHVWGTLPGTTDEDITIIAHMDGYFHAALDNGSGLAAMIGLVEHFAAVPPEERRRNIRFVGTAGHHGGGVGVRDMHENRDTVFENTVLVINLEHVAQVSTKYWENNLRMHNTISPMRWWVFGGERLLDVTLDSFNRFNVGLTGDMQPGAVGEIGAIYRDVPSIQLITSREIKHTEQEFPEWIPAVGLEQITRAYARIIDEVNELTWDEIRPPEGYLTDDE